MDDKVPCCVADAARKVRKIRLPGGVMIGISGLDETIAEVAALGLENEVDIKAELLSRVKAGNYVPRPSELDYVDALYKEFMMYKDKS